MKKAVIMAIMLMTLGFANPASAEGGEARAWATSNGGTWMQELESVAQAVASGSRIEGFVKPKGEWLVWSEGAFGGVSPEDALARLGSAPAAGTFVAADVVFDGTFWNAGYVTLTPMSSPTVDEPKPAKPTEPVKPTEPTEPVEPTVVETTVVETTSTTAPESVDETPEEPVVDQVSISEVEELGPAVPTDLKRSSMEPQMAWMYLPMLIALVLFVGKLVRRRS